MCFLLSQYHLRVNTRNLPPCRASYEYLEINVHNISPEWSGRSRSSSREESLANQAETLEKELMHMHTHTRPHSEVSLLCFCFFDNFEFRDSRFTSSHPTRRAIPTVFARFGPDPVDSLTCPLRVTSTSNQFPHTPTQTDSETFWMPRCSRIAPFPSRRLSALLMPSQLDAELVGASHSTLL